MDQTHRFTIFPNLHPTNSPPTTAIVDSGVFALPVNSTRENILLTWATLLHGHVPADSTVFRVDAEAAVVQFDGGKLEYTSTARIHATAEDLEAGRYSAVYFAATPSGVLPQLYLTADVERATARLFASSMIMPAAHPKVLAVQFAHILAHITVSPGSIPAFPAIGKAETPMLPVGGLSILNPHPQKLPGPTLLHELVRFSEHGAKPALDFLHASGLRTIHSYNELDTLSTAFAQLLVPHLQTTSRPMVPVLLPQSPSLYIALLGILKAGAAFVPLQLDAPAERLRFVVADVGATCVITDSNLSTLFNWPNCPSIVITDGAPTTPAHSFILPTRIDAASPAYVMYTSGSTGTPKGVPISHSAATQSLLAHERHIGGFERWLQFASPTFDVSVFDTFFPLIRGKVLVGCSRAQLLGDLAGAVNVLEVDAIELTPTVAGGLLGKREGVPGLKMLLTIGEMLTTQVVREYGDGALQGMYGPTEATIHCTVARNLPRAARTGDVGVPLDTVSAYIIGASTEIEVLPVGWVGELAVGGHQLAEGYLGRPELTAGAFVETHEHGRLYRTGDRARVLPGGRIECFGRVDAGQVKLRGQRVELGEVEEIVRRTPGVTGAVASVLNGTMVVFVGGQMRRAAVRETCARCLPQFMIPGDIVVFDELPTLSSGKADRKRLEKEYTAQTPGESGDQLQGEELVIADAVHKLLSIRPDKERSLLALGLDSIHAIRLASALRALGRQVTAVDILGADTVAGIAYIISTGCAPQAEDTSARFAAVRAAARSVLLPQHQKEIVDILPCTSVQAAMLAETSQHPFAYCNWILLSLPLSLLAPAIESAFRGVIERNEILRTGFLSVEDGFAQLVWAASRPGQFRMAGRYNAEWSATVDSLFEPACSATLVAGHECWELSVNIHHALYDGWSWEQILVDFDKLLGGGTPIPRPQFREVVEYELARPETTTDATLERWRETLTGFSPARIPSLHGRSDVLSATGTEALDLHVSRARYEAAARALGVAPQTIVQAAWAFLLSFYVGSTDVVFGTVASGRTTGVEGIEYVLGPTILTLPVRVDVDRDRMVADVVADVAARNRDCMVSEIGLRDIRRACGIEGPLFESLLVWQQALERPAEGVVRIVDSRDRLEFAILIEIEPGMEGIVLRATYQSAVLPQAHVKLMLKQLDQLVSGIVACPDQSLSSLQCAFDETVLAVENPNPSVVPMIDPPSLAGLVERAAAKSPNAIALEFAQDIVDGVLLSKKLTYAELNSEANKLAYHLLSLGAVPDSFVCVCMEKGPAAYISILAILKTGAGYLPLRPETPKDRILQILEIAGVALCLTTSEVEKALAIPASVRVVCVDKTNVQSLATSNPPVERRGDTLAYAVFTSGSTGVPKGVLINNDSVVNNMQALGELYPTKTESRMLQFCSIDFDVSVFDIFFTWSMGMTLCSGTRDFLLRDIEGAINALGVTHLSMTPTVAALVNPENVPGVEFLVVAGEALTQKVFIEWADKGLYQGYGPSETVNICTVRPAVRKTDHINNLGPPFANTSAFVVSYPDDAFSLVPRGGVGEFCFGGGQVGRGYLKMPELTSQKFITHPKYGRIYRSGDIGRMLVDGSLEFVGREDNQIKIRGHRIELEEISSVILRSAAVVDTLTMPIRNKDTDAYQLVTFVLLNDQRDNQFAVVKDSEGVKREVMNLFTAASSLLPAYMVPVAIIPVTVLPMTTRRKIDKMALQAAYLLMESSVLESYMDTSGNEDKKEWTKVEEEIVAIIAAISRAEIGEIGRNTSIFKLGLDSISAIQLSNRIMKAGYPRLDVSQVMKNPTVGALAALVGIQPGTETEDGVGRDLLDRFSREVRASALEQLGVLEDDVVRILPCTPLQEAMLSQKEGMHARTYYNHAVLKLKADTARLRRAWAIMVDRHEIMRTCFCVTSHPRHAYAQVVLKHHQLPWTVLEMEVTAALIDDRITTVSTSMEITRTPYAFSLFLGHDRSVLVMSFHHSLYDGFAMDLLLDDVRQAYYGLDLPTRGNFGSVLEYMENIDLAAADIFWTGMLTGLELSSFPDLTGRSPMAREKLIGMASSRITCSRPLDSIEEGCRNLSTSLLALGQTGWARLLSSYSGETDLCFGNVVSGRTIPIEGVEDIIAPCFNTIPMRIQLTAGSTNMSVMDSLQRLNADVLPYQLTPLRRIMGALKTEGQPLFDTLFVLQHAHQSSFGDLWEELEDRGEMDFAIVVVLVPSRNKNTLDIILHFRRNTILEEHASVVLRQLDEAIISSFTNPTQLAVDFSSFDLALLSMANSRLLYPTETGCNLLHSEFERHARENPSRNALEYLNSDGTVATWTFEKLNQAANQVSHYLISLGLKRDEAVPLCLEKSPIFYICVLGVLKAGCAFTPIDPSFPSQRKLFMIEELGAKFVLANRATAKDILLPAHVKVIDIDGALCVKSQPITNPEVFDLTPGCLACRLYTSGSTGQPKAVALEIKNVVHTVKSVKTLIPWKEDSRLLQFAATTFDMCYYDCFMAWSYGFTLCSAAKNHLLGNLEGTIRTLKTTLLDLTPTVASTLSAENLPGVEMLYCGGEMLTQKVINDWDGRCINSYGPTETTMSCTMTRTSKQVKASNIGKPFPTASLFIFSRDGGYIVPTLGSGELYIGGLQVAREYHNNSQLTRSRFIRLGRDIVYRTGDIVRMLADGTFEFIGRADDQVKIRGLRIELGEVSSVLKESHPNVKDATTIILRHSENAKRQLISFLATEGRKQHGTEIKVLDVNSQIGDILVASRAAARGKLPPYMIPGVILIIDHIPHSVSGKVDKKALEALFKKQDIRSFSVSTVEDDDESAWTEDEKKMRDVFSQISQVPAEQISRSSTIYEIGLDSISAAQVAMRLKHVGLQVSVLDILERPSISQISTFLAATTRNAVTNGNIPDGFLSQFNNRFMGAICTDMGITEKEITGIYPCTSAQEGMLSQFLRSKGELYFNHTVFRLPEGVDLGRLQGSWDAVFKSHDMLRAGFAGVDDARHSFALVVHEKEAVSLPWSSITSKGDMDKVISARKKAHASRALQNLCIPPWSISVIKGPLRDHMLIFSAHHALYDAQSLGFVLDDVLDEYSGKGSLPRPKFSAALSSIIKHTVEPKILEDNKAFWINQLQGSSISRFPNMCPVRVKSTASHVCSIKTGWSLSKIDTRCRQLGFSIHAAGQAAWARVLSAYMGDFAVTMGIVLSGRAGIDNAENVAFPCITTVPSLCILTGTNRELVLALQANNAQLLKHQHTPLRSIQNWFEHPQESFFDSIFAYQKGGSDARRLSSIWEIAEENASVDYAISLEIEPTGADSLLVHITCRDNVVPKEQTTLILDHFEAALMDILENPNNSSTEFTGFPPALLSCTPAEEDEIPSDIHLLHKFVEKYRRLSPEKVAFEFATSIQKGNTIKETWTYAQLDEEGNRVANYLLRRGVKTGDIIGICFEKCPEASFAILGILKAGCAFLALDYNAPIDRKAFIMEDSRAKFMLTMDRFAQDLRNKLKVDVVALDSDMAVKASSYTTPIVVDLTPDDLCYCLYTSGTTGAPKGCELTHQNAIQAMLAFQRLFSGHWDAESRFLQFASFHFDVSVLEQYWSWSVGICVTSAPRDLIFQNIPLTINELQITHLDLTPSLAALLRPEDVPSLCRGVFITGGEQLKQEILDTWGEVGVIYNGYGPTEVTIGCTMYPRVPANGKPSNIGPQFVNVGSFVLVPGTDKPVPRGAIGELCVSGKLVGRGYLNRPSLTEEKFPFLEKFNTRIYRTGDLVRILHDGTFDFAGRADDQVKLRGQRLEIGEINETLKKADSRVRSVATLVLRHPKQQKDQLVSFIVLGTSDSSGKSDPIVLDGPEQHEIIPLLGDSCKRMLPMYMVPTHFLPISKMPLSVNNKVDHKKLTTLYQGTSLALLQQISRREEIQGSWTDAEKRIQRLLAEMTGLQPSDIKRSSTVFELGLDSVSVVGLARRLKKDGFFASTVSLVMQYPGIQQLATQLSKGENNSSQDFATAELIRQRLAAFANQGTFDVCDQLELEPDQVAAIVPCTALQEGMIIRFLDSEKPLYYNSFLLSLSASTDTALLRAAWDTVVRSTGILRTCFCETSDGYAQVVLKESRVQWREIVIRSHQEVQNVVSEEMMNHVSKNEDLHQTPLYLLLLRTPSKCILVVNIFHALYDGNSLPLILDDVQRAYRNQFKPRPHQFSDIIGHILSVDLVKAKEFWETSLAKSHPTSFPKNSGLSADGDYLVQLKPKLVIEDVEKFCRKLNCTPQSVFQAAWASVLYTCLGPQSVFGIVVSGRSLPLENIDDTIGPLFNTIPCYLDIESAPTWEKLVQQAHRFNSESITYHHTPLHLINKWMGVSVENQLFDTLFVYQRNLTDGNTTEPSLWELIDSSTVADYPLALEIEESLHNGLNFSIVAKRSVVTEQLSLQLLSDFEKQLHNILKDSQGKPLTIKGTESSSFVPTESNTRADTDVAHGFPWSAEAQILRKVIATLVDIGETEVDEDSSIFELGLDSIEAIKLSSRLRSNGIKLSVSTIMRNPTIRKMQDVLSQSPRQTNDVPNVNQLVVFEQQVRRSFLKNGLKNGLKDDQIEAIYPATPLQEGMIAETLASGYKLYFNHDALELASWVDVERLCLAWETVIHKSEILRTSFFHVSETVSDSPYSFGQIVHKRVKHNLSEVILSSEENTTESIKNIMRRASESVDMLKEPPLRITILRAPEKSYLVLSISHALYDGWSMGLMYEDVQNAYFGSILPRPSCRILLETIFGTNPKDSERFWKQMLSGAPTSNFPLLENTPDSVVTYRFEKKSALQFLEIQSFCKTVGVTVQSLGQMCWGLLLAHYLGEPDVLFGTVLSGRDFESAEDIIFPAMNTVPVRAIVHGSYKDMLQYMQGNSARVLKYQHTPLRQIQKMMKNDGQRLFDTLFIYQRKRESVKGHTKAMWHSIEGASDVEYNVCVEMEHSGESLVWRNACKSTVMIATDAEALLGLLDSLLAHIVENTDYPTMTYRDEGISFGNIQTIRARPTGIANLNGVRINLDETAMMIQQGQDSVKDSAAIITKEDGRYSLVAFITGHPEDGQQIADVDSIALAVSELARQTLPHWMIPSFIIPMDTLPYIDNKINRKKLESHFLSIPLVERNRFAVKKQNGEWSPLERTFRSIFARVSQLPETEIERTQTIFHLGLDSISAISVSAELRKESIFLSVAEILRAATIERMVVLAKTIDGEISQTSVDTEKTIQKALENIDRQQLLREIPEESIESVLPGTAGQFYMLSTWRNSNYRLFMPTFTLRYPKVELSRIISAWESLIRQESILRTTFLATENEHTPLVQVTLRNPPVQYEWYQSSTTNNDALIQFLVSQEQRKLVNLELPPVRLTILNTPADTIAFLTIHHALYDGTSLPLLLAKFQGFLENDAKPPQISNLDVPRFPSFVAFVHSQDIQRQSSFWRKYLDGSISTLVPLKYPDVKCSVRTEVYRPGVLGRSGLLDSRCRAKGVSLHSIFLAAYAKVYVHHLGLRDGPARQRDDVVFGIYLSNRHLPVPNLVSMTAPTLNIIPLRIRSPGVTSLIELAQQVQGDLVEIGSASNAVVGLWQIEKWTGVQVDCFFNFMKTLGSPGEENGEIIGKEKMKIEEFKIGAIETVRTGLMPPNRWMDIAKTNLDIEVAVRGDQVDVGVFSETRYFSNEDAQNTIKWMCEIVTDCLEI